MQCDAVINKDYSIFRSDNLNMVKKFDWMKTAKF